MYIVHIDNPKWIPWILKNKVIVKITLQQTTTSPFGGTINCVFSVFIM